MLVDLFIFRTVHEDDPDVIRPVNDLPTTYNPTPRRRQEGVELERGDVTVKREKTKTMESQLRVKSSNRSPVSFQE